MRFVAGEHFGGGTGTFGETGKEGTGHFYSPPFLAFSLLPQKALL